MKGVDTGKLDLKESLIMVSLPSLSKAKEIRNK